jgi:hypothetical protein
VIKNKILAAILSISLVTILVLSGPAEAFAASLTISDAQVEQGEKLTFTSELEISQGEFLNINEIILRLEGPTNVTCKFDVNGTKLEDCEGISIKKISDASFGYGYGYGYGLTNGTLTYEISVNTNKLDAGNYSSELGVVIDDNEQDYAGDDFEIIEKVTGNDFLRCILKAEQGETVIWEGDAYPTNMPVDFMMSFHENNNGTEKLGPGHLMIKQKKENLKFDYQIEEVLVNNETTLQVRAVGEIKTGGQAKNAAEADITFDKITGEISIVSDDFSVSGMPATFRQFC